MARIVGERLGAAGDRAMAARLVEMISVIGKCFVSAIRIINARHPIEGRVTCKPSLIARFIRGGAKPIGVPIVWIKAARPTAVDIIDGGPLILARCVDLREWELNLSDVPRDRIGGIISPVAI